MFYCNAYHVVYDTQFSTRDGIIVATTIAAKLFIQDKFIFVALSNDMKVKFGWSIQTNLTVVSISQLVSY